MARIQPAMPSDTLDFWPADDPAAWSSNPIASFSSWLALQRVVGAHGFRESSFETYSAIFALWVRYLAERKLGFLEALDQDASRFFEEHTLEPVSRRRYLQLLDKVYRHLRAIGWQGDNPMFTELRKERVLDTLMPPSLSTQELARLIDFLTPGTSWKASRDRAVAAFTLGAGLRTNELIALRAQQINDQFQIEVTSSSVHRSHMTLILPYDAYLSNDFDLERDLPWRSWVEQWLEVRAHRKIPGELLCPATLAGKAYSPSGLFRRINTWLEETEIDAPQKGANILRNTFARCALTCGRYSLAQVQEFLGHEEARATARHAPLPADPNPGMPSGKP